jgi:MbtH protein
MTSAFDAEGSEFRVLVNEYGQHSLWPAFRAAPAGWAEIGPTGDRKHCLDWIETNWKDIRPQSKSDACATG